MKKKRITLIYQQLDLGGRQIALLALAAALKRRGWQVELVSFLPGVLESRFRSLGIPVTVFYDCPKINRIWRLRKHFLTTQTTIVHTHLFSAGFWGRIAAKLAAVPVIVHTEGGMPFEDKRWKRIPAEKLLTQISDSVICVAQAIKDHLIQAGGLAAESLLVIPNGVSSEALLELPLRPMADTPVIFSAGRLAQVKGYDLLIKAVAQLQGFTGRLVLAGDGPEAAGLRDLSNSLGVADRVQFLGYREDIQDLLAASDLYVTPSRSEGMSNSILEAMAAGVPVVATDVGGNRELLGDSGRIVPSEDPAALASAIQHALSETETTTQLARAARQRVKDIYSLDKVVAAHEELYVKLLARKGVRVS